MKSTTPHPDGQRDGRGTEGAGSTSPSASTCGGESAGSSTSEGTGAGKGAGTGAAARECADASPRYTIRFESSVTRLASAATEADRARLHVLELSAGVILEHVIENHGFDVPDGDAPYKFATVAGSVARYGGKVEEDGGEACDNIIDIKDAWRLGLSDDFDEPLTCVDLVLVPKTSTVLVRYDEEFAKSVRSRPAAPEPEAEELPIFPGFEPDTDFSRWVHDNVYTEDVAETSTILGTSTPRTYRHLTSAMTVIHGLPRFADRARGDEFTNAHVDVAADLCQTVAMRFLPLLDEYLADRRADVTSESFRTSLRKKIYLLEPPIDRSEAAARRRRVYVDTFKDGTACMSMTGPAEEIHASFQRIQAMARAVYAGQSDTFNLAPGVEVIDERSINALMFDIATRPRPLLNIKVRQTDPVTEVESTREFPLMDGEGNLLFEADEHGVSGLVDCTQSGSTTPTAGTAFSEATVPPPAQTSEYSVMVAMPTDQWWLANQAAVVTTVPYLTITGDSDLPGTLADGSPIPAETARRIAGRSKTLTRILTDPATGTPIDAKATTYRVPNDVRKTLIAQWAICTVPGCTRRAEKSEIDHVDPFFHLDPLKGGLTRFGNLHPLCKKHHAVKTARRYSVRMPESGLVEFEFFHGVKSTVSTPDQPVDVAQALEFYSLSGIGPRRWRLPKHKVPPPPLVLELMPGESAIRDRDEAKKREQEIADHKRRLQECYDLGRAKRQRLMIDRMLDWKDAVFQACLLPGSNSITMKRLTRGRRRINEHARPTRYRDNRTSKIEYVRINKDWLMPRVQWEHDLTNDPPPF